MTVLSPPDRSKAIRTLNDRFRQRLPVIGDVPGEILFTQGIQTLCSTPQEPFCYLGDLFETIRTYREFGSDNDPYGEHDFGNFAFQGETCYWKIDYYAPDRQSGAEDPADPDKTLRVLTVMLSIEY